MKQFIEISTEDCVVKDAWEYKPPITHQTEKQPYIELDYGKSNLVIEDRYILFRLLRALDNELMYADMMFTLYEIPTTERPTLKEIIQGYFDHTEHAFIGLWIDESKVLEVEPTGNQSRYFESTMQFIGANYLPDFQMSIRHMRPYPHAIYKSPVMSFTKNTFKIEITSYKNLTKIVARYKVGGFWVQPIPTQEIKKWIHTIKSDKLEKMLWNALSALDHIDNLEIKVLGSGGNSERLHDFISRNKLERENMNSIAVKKHDKDYFFQ